MSHSPMPPLGEGRCVPELQNFDWNRFFTFLVLVGLFPVNFWFLIRLAASRRKLLVSRKRKESRVFHIPFSGTQRTRVLFRELSQ